MRQYKNDRVECTVCEKIVRGKVPAGGDGSLRKPIKHKDNDGLPCAGSLSEGELKENNQ